MISKVLTIDEADDFYPEAILNHSQISEDFDNADNRFLDLNSDSFSDFYMGVVENLVIDNEDNKKLNVITSKDNNSKVQINWSKNEGNFGYINDNSLDLEPEVYSLYQEKKKNQMDKITYKSQDKKPSFFTKSNLTFKIFTHHNKKLNTFKRKFQPDDIKKKIKAKFHKTLKEKINQYLKEAGSKLLFESFPQCWITNISREKNLKFLNMTYREMLEYNFFKEMTGKKKLVDEKKYQHNQMVLSYLDSNENIKKASRFDFLSETKYKDILNEYFSSKDFEDTLNSLKKKEGNYYIKEYYYHAKNYVYFFESYKKENSQRNVKLGEASFHLQKKRESLLGRYK